MTILIHRESRPCRQKRLLARTFSADVNKFEVYGHFQLRSFGINPVQLPILNSDFWKLFQLEISFLQFTQSKIRLLESEFEIFSRTDATEVNAKYVLKHFSLLVVEKHLPGKRLESISPTIAKIVRIRSKTYKIVAKF